MFYRFNKNLERLTGGGRCRIVVAVSGGPDSICLLHLLCRSLPVESLLVAHMNFNLRGVESDADELFVREVAAQWGVASCFKSVDTLAYARDHSLSVEMAARELRYGWFEELRLKNGADYIAVAHNANDNAETLLLNLCRGTGIKGLCGMRELDGRHLLRPLLGFSRARIESYLKENSIPFRTDSTNAENTFSRNRIRNRVLAELKQINPSVISTLNGNMERFRMASAVLERAVGELRRRFSVSGREYAAQVAGSSGAAAFLTGYLSECHIREVVDTASLAKEGSEVCGYVIYTVLSDYGFNPSQCSDMAVAAVGTERKRIENNDFVAIAERGRIKVYDAALFAVPGSVKVDCPSGGKAVESVFGSLRLRFSLLPNKKGALPTREERSLFITADSLHFPLLLRSMQPGDRFSPFGLGGSKKLSDYYTDLKLDNAIKRLVPLLEDSTKKSPDNIVALPGLEISNRFRVTSESETLLKITLL